MKPTPFYYRWWFITICFLTVYLIPVGVILLIVRCQALIKENAALVVYKQNVDSITERANADAEEIRERAR